MAHFAVTLLITLALLAVMIFGMATLLMAYFITQRYKIKIALRAEWQKGTHLLGICLHRAEMQGISIHLIFFSIGFQTQFSTL